VENHRRFWQNKQPKTQKISLIYKIMTIQDNNYNQDPFNSPEQSVSSILLMRKALVRSSAKKVLEADIKMTIPRSENVQQKAANWAKTYNPLEWMSVQSTHSEKDVSAINSITDGKLRLQEIIKPKQPEPEVVDVSEISNDTDMENPRLVQARALVDKAYDGKPYQLLPSDPIGITDLRPLTNDQFGLAA
jgi:hypothetical protein